MERLSDIASALTPIVRAVSDRLASTIDRLDRLASRLAGSSRTLKTLASSLRETASRHGPTSHHGTTRQRGRMPPLVLLV
jgi:hypothetical protein